MTIARPATFWIIISVIAVAALVLLRPILMPFAIGMALAYLLAPVVDRLEAAGIHRPVAALMLILPLLVAVVGAVVVMLPAIVGEFDFFVEQFPRYLARLQELIADSSRPWLHRIVGEELHVGRLPGPDAPGQIATTMGSAWLEDTVRSLWTGGEALASLLSLLVVVPIVSIYLLADWKSMTTTVEGWMPPGRREDVRALGREVHDMVAGFVRGQIVICLILAVFYATALKLMDSIMPC